MALTVLVMATTTATIPIGESMIATCDNTMKKQRKM